MWKCLNCGKHVADIRELCRYCGDRRGAFQEIEDIVNSTTRDGRTAGVEGYSQRKQPKNISKDEINNEILERLWNDPMIRTRCRIMNETIPGSIANNEIVVHEDDLKQAGYIGRLPFFIFRFGKFGFLCLPHLYKGYWMRQKFPDRKGQRLYSIFKEENVD
jgi:hypothetical protein